MKYYAHPQNIMCNSKTCPVCVARKYENRNRIKPTDVRKMHTIDSPGSTQPEARKTSIQTNPK